MHSEASSLLEPIKPADADAAELAALRAVYDNEEVPVDPEEQAARRRDTCRALAVAVAVAATGWALYYEFGDVAIFAYGIVVSASHYAYQRFFQAKAAPHPLTTLAFANCVVLVVAYASLRTKERRAWLVAWNGVASGFATALLVLAFAAAAARPAVALGFDEDYVLANPYVDDVARVGLAGLGAIMVVSNGLGAYLIAYRGVDPNAPVYSSFATVLYNWAGAVLAVLWVLALRKLVAPALEKRRPKVAFSDFLEERAKRRRPRRSPEEA